MINLSRNLVVLLLFLCTLIPASGSEVAIIPQCKVIKDLELNQI